jgi:hypothetical protein
MADVRPNSIGSELWAQMPVSPDAYPQQLDLVRRLVLIVRLDTSAYRAASFLDDRMLGPNIQGVWMSVARTSEAAQQVTELRPLHFIFHTGHVGSTLLSRLLDETGLVLSLREPLPLRSLADAYDVLERPESLLDRVQFADLLNTFLRLWARGYDWTRAVVVKATSSAGRAATAVLEASPQSRAIYLNLHAEPYLATLLAGENSPQDLRGHGPGRMKRLQAFCSAPPRPLHELSMGELAALGWLVETHSQQTALSHFPGRVQAVDFDAFLEDVRGGMERVVQLFGLSPEPAFLARIAQSPVLGFYSKAPGRPFTREARAELLRQSRRDHGAEIAKGLAWLEALARSDPAVAAIVESGREPA